MTRQAIFRPPELATASSNGAQPGPYEPQVMTITPEMAKDWLDRNNRNRPIRYSEVGNYARDMKAGKWVLNGETIKIAADGGIIDGQHRLLAVLQAEVPIRSVVVPGLPPGVQDTVDVGIKRKASDQLALRGEQYATLLSAVARWAWKWQRGVRGKGGTQDNPTFAEMGALIDATPILREATAYAAAAREDFRSVRGSVFGMGYLIFSEVNDIAARAFLDRVRDGADIPAGHPAHTFRARIWRARETGERLNEYEQLALLVYAWNAFREDRALARLQLPKGGLTPKTFPEPK